MQLVHRTDLLQLLSHTHHHHLPLSSILLCISQTLVYFPMFTFQPVTYFLFYDTLIQSLPTICHQDQIDCIQ